MSFGQPMVDLYGLFGLLSAASCPGETKTFDPGSVPTKRPHSNERRNTFEPHRLDASVSERVEHRDSVLNTGQPIGPHAQPRLQVLERYRGRHCSGPNGRPFDSAVNRNPTLDAHPTTKLDPNRSDPTLNMGRPQHRQRRSEPISTSGGLTGGHALHTIKVRDQQQGVG